MAATGHWSILLQSFPADAGREQQRAITLVRMLTQLDRRFGGAFVHTTDTGAMVMLGRYDSVDDELAQADLEFVKAQSIRGREDALFPRAMLTRVRAQRGPTEYGPMELLSTRVGDPRLARAELFTFQVAVWGTFREFAQSGDRVPSAAEVRRSAEAYARQLRGQGYPAFYHHDLDKEISMVTLGAFTTRDFDVTAGLYLNPDLDRFDRAFREHLVNGEPVITFGKEQLPQRPQLVRIPELP